jgi:hypothetical protein
MLRTSGDLWGSVWGGLLGWPGGQMVRNSLDVRAFIIIFIVAYVLKAAQCSRSHVGIVSWYEIPEPGSRSRFFIIVRGWIVGTDCSRP